jgi:hypothetical protein
MPNLKTLNRLLKRFCGFSLIGKRHKIWENGGEKWLESNFLLKLWLPRFWLFIRRFFGVDKGVQLNGESADGGALGLGVV